MIDAVRLLDSGMFSEIPAWAEQAMVTGELCPNKAGKGYLIKTPEGVLQVAPGNYIICNAKGELYPCNPDTFEMNYEKVEA